MVPVWAKDGEKGKAGCQNFQGGPGRDFITNRWKGPWARVENERAREAARIRDHNLCQDCLQRGRVVFADTVHHIEPVRDEWHKRLQLDNLVSLCRTCHEARHSKQPARSGIQRKPS